MKTTNPRIRLPKSWPIHVRTAILYVISLAQFATTHTRSWAADSINSRIRLQAERDRALEELSRLREEMRIKDARMAMISPHRRPHYQPTERLAILELKAARGWSMEQTARVFHVTAPTIASWLSRLDEEGPDALVQTRSPVNRFPDFVRYVVQRLKTLCPLMGKVKIAQVLARAGLHLGATTVGRMLKEDPSPKPRSAGTHSSHRGADAPQAVSTRTTSLPRVVQRRKAAHDVGWQNAERSVLWAPPVEPAPAYRTATTMAARLAMCKAAHVGGWQAG